MISKILLSILVFLISFEIQSQSETDSIPIKPITRENIDMTYNYNHMDRDFVVDEEIMRKTSNVIKAQKISLFAERDNSVYNIYIINNTNDTIRITEQDARLRLIQEAKDENGSWKPIEFWKYSTCGNSYFTVKISPKEIIKTASKAYDGNFKTVIRFKLLDDDVNYYSNEVSGNINLSLFELSEKVKINSGLESEKFRLGESAFKKMMFLEPGGSAECMQNQKKWIEKITEMNRKRNSEKQ